jgi:putative ABC transport system permease protein
MPDLLPRQGERSRRRHLRRRRVRLAGAARDQKLGLKVGAGGVTAARGDATGLDHAHRRRPARGAARRPAAGGRHRPRAGTLRPADGVSEGRIRLAPDTDSASLAGGMGSAAAARPAAARRRRQPGARVSNISRAYRVNLNVLALVALLTGAFLVFATQLTAVAQRSTQFALLGVLGLSPRMRLLQVLLEGLAIGVPGAALGLGLGYALALAFTRLLGGDLGGGFFSGSAPVIVPLPAGAGLLLALGCAASLAGALYPAWLNRMQPLAQALKTGFAQRRVPAARMIRDAQRGGKAVAGGWRWRGGAGADAAAGRSSTCRWPAMRPSRWCWCSASPRTAGHATCSARWLARRKLPAPQRDRGAERRQAPLMAQVAASGLIVSFALTVSMVTMVSSFRVALDQWLDAVLPAPLYCAARACRCRRTARRAGTARRTLRPRRAHGRRLRWPRSAAAAVACWCATWTAPIRRAPALHRPGACPPAGDIAGLDQRSRCTRLYRLAPGQTLRLPLLGREVEVFVGGVWRDYSRQFGAVVMAATTTARWAAASRPPTSRSGRGRAEAAAAPGSRPGRRHGLDGVAERRDPRPEPVDLRQELRRHLRAGSRRHADRTVRPGGDAGRQRLAARARTGDARRAGFRPRHADPRRDARRRADRRRSACFIGLACGIAVGAILTHVVNPQAFHWRMPLHIPWPGAARRRGDTARPVSPPAASPRARPRACRWRRFWPAPSKHRRCAAAASWPLPCCCRCWRAPRQWKHRSPTRR